MLFLFISAILAVFLLYGRRGYLAYVVLGAGTLGMWYSHCGSEGVGFDVLMGTFVVTAVLFGVRPLRAQILTRAILPIFAKVLPTISETEKQALEAGTVWWDSELFTGDPKYAKLLGTPKPKLSAEEEAFLAGPCEELCKMLDSWSIYNAGNLPDKIWAFIKKHRFFAMIIPKEYGGLEFSNYCHSRVITMLASRNIATMVTVMVPNSLGPAELLLKYGTEEQKKTLLPKLAAGEEIPCFALTEPHAGSDAASGRSTGVVCKQNVDGKEVLGIRLNWTKRYITLAPIATLIGVSFKLLDPDGLLGDKKDIGITLALVPHDTPGVEKGKRHDPLGSPFLNGPTTGKDVFIPIESIIGGQKMAGKGWRMLMDCLSVGRSTSLPSMAVGLGKLTARVTSGYSMVREQFNTKIARFEGIEEPLARIAGSVYIASATRNLTMSAVDMGEHPSVISAICKAYLTELMRDRVNDGMDILAGAAICQGPRNIMATPYASVPVAITVEGANILTRTLIIYGQGALRCHPFVRSEVEAAQAKHVVDFDRAFFGHINFVASLWARTQVMSLGHRIFGAKFGASIEPSATGPLSRETKTYLHKMTRLSSAFALTSDACMAILGGSLKRKEMISGRLADALSWLYLTSATVKQYVDDGEPEIDRPMFLWACEHGLFQVQEALNGVIDNLPFKLAGRALKMVLFPLGRGLKPPSDKLNANLARHITTDPEARIRLTREIYIPDENETGLGRLELAYEKVLECSELYKKVKKAARRKQFEVKNGDSLPKAAERAGMINSEECSDLEEMIALCDDVIQVDSFEPEMFRKKTS